MSRSDGEHDAIPHSVTTIDSDGDATLDLPPVPVKISGEKVVAADIASWNTWVLTGNEAPFQILAQSKRRSKAKIFVFSFAGGVLGGAVQQITLCRKSQIGNAQLSSVGALALTPFSHTYEAQSEVWAVPSVVNGAVILTVIDEWNLADEH